MKKIFILFFALIGFIGNSQINGYVEYEYSKNLGVEYETIGILTFNSFESEFIELSPGYMPTVDLENDGKIIATSYSEMRPLIYTNLKNDSLYARQTLFKKVYITKETIPNIDWKLGDKYKMIDKFSCQLAFGSFRGRTYKAWFTTDIPIIFGPWKLQGLPGLILEANDEKNAIIFKAKKIVIGLKTDIANFDKSGARELKSFIDLKDNIYKEKEKTMSAKVPRNAQFKLSMPKRNTQKEILYEWENMKTKED